MVDGEYRVWERGVDICSHPFGILKRVIWSRDGQVLKDEFVPLSPRFPTYEREEDILRDAVKEASRT